MQLRKRVYSKEKAENLQDIVERYEGVYWCRSTPGVISYELTAILYNNCPSETIDSLYNIGFR